MTPLVQQPISTLTVGDPVRQATQAAGQSGGKPGSVDAVAQEFEQVFIAQMLNHMFSGIKTDGPFGGGQGEEAFRGFLLEEYAKAVSDTGGLGLADDVRRTLLSLQEVQ